MRILLLGCAAACVLLAAGPPAVPAAPYIVSVMQDDNQLAYGTPGQRRQALDRMKSLGVEAVRVTLLWKAVAPAGDSRRKPRGFNGANPADYPRSQWDLYDDLVIAAAERGILVYLNPTGGGPRWAHAKASNANSQRSWRPKVGEFRKFMTAAGRRYSGTWRDENGTRQHLPRVWWWGLWNEPNQPGWLTPQARRRRGVGMVAASPHLYRELTVAAAGALSATGHADDLVLIGELAPLGSARAAGPRRPLRPGIFLREMFCVDRKFRRFSGRRARVRHCGGVERLSILERFPRLGFGHHPYTKELAPNTPEKGRDAITMANIDALPKLLDRLAARTGLLPPEMPIFLTEYGYETDPPDPFNGISPTRQAEYLNEGDYIAWKHPRIFSNTQFQLNDVPGQVQYPRNSRGHWFTYQSGLFTARPADRPKPAAGAYAFPLVVKRTGGTALIWGQVRFAPNGSRQQVRLQSRARGSQTWLNSGAAFEVANHQGFFQVTRQTAAGTTWRAVWVEPDFSRTLFSREAVAR